MKNKKITIGIVVAIVILAIIGAIVLLPKWQSVERWRGHLKKGVDAKSFTLTPIKGDSGKNLVLDESGISVSEMKKNGETWKEISTTRMPIGKFSNSGAGFYTFISASGEESTIQVQLDRFEVVIRGQKFYFPFENLGFHAG